MLAFANPEVPFRQQVSLRNQHIFKIKGRPLKDAKRFFFAFQMGPLSDAQNVAFRFDVRFAYMSEDHVIVMQFRQNGEWSKEIVIRKFPFSVKDQFKIEIVVTDDMYMVKVNDVEIAQYQHQLPLANVDYFTIGGDVFLANVEIN